MIAVNKRICNRWVYTGAIKPFTVVSFNHLKVFGHDAGITETNCYFPGIFNCTLIQIKLQLVRGQTGSVVERQRYWSYMFFVGLSQFFSDAPN